MTVVTGPDQAQSRADSDPAAAPETERRRTPRGRLVIGLALVAALVLAVVLGRQALDQRAQTQDRSAALAAARQIAVNFSTLDYRTFDRDTARVTAAATGRSAATSRPRRPRSSRSSSPTSPCRRARWPRPRSCQLHADDGARPAGARRQRHQHQHDDADRPPLPGPARPDQGPRPLARQPAAVRRMRTRMTPTKARAAALAAAATTSAGPRRRVAGARRRAGGETVIELGTGDRAARHRAARHRAARRQTSPTAVTPSLDLSPRDRRRAERLGVRPVGDPVQRRRPGRPARRGRPHEPRTATSSPAVIPAVLSLCLVAVLAACLLAAADHAARPGAGRRAGDAAARSRADQRGDDPELRLPAPGQPTSRRRPR